MQCHRRLLATALLSRIPIAYTAVLPPSLPLLHSSSALNHLPASTLPSFSHSNPFSTSTPTFNNKSKGSSFSGIKDSRSSSWSFKTKYPRPSKFSKPSSGGSGRFKKRRPDAAEGITGLALPPRLKLAKMRRGDDWHSPKNRALEAAAAGEEKGKGFGVGRFGKSGGRFERRAGRAEGKKFERPGADRTEEKREKEWKNWEKDGVKPQGGAGRIEKSSGRFERPGDRRLTKRPAPKPSRKDRREGKSRRPGVSTSDRTASPPRHMTRQQEFEMIQRQRNQHESQREWIAAQQVHATKFAMEPLDVTPSTQSKLKEAMQSVTFDGMGLRKEIVEALQTTLGMKCKPTPVQALAIPASLDEKRSGRTLLIGAETGSGKTLAYLLPMIHRLREAEAEEAKRFSSVSDDMMNVVEAVVSTPSLASQSPDALAEQLASKSETTPRPPPSKVRLPKRPRGIILVPTRDLVDQVTQVAKTLCSHNARLIVMGIHSRPRHAASVKRKIATSPVDILVCTPRALATHFEDHELLPDRVQEIVVDEADTLMDTSFAYELDQCLDPIMKRKVDDETPETLFTYVSATFPRTMITRLTKIHPTHIRIATPKLHKTLPGLKQTFLRVSGSDSKPTLLLDTLKMGRIGGDAHVIVFCNRVQTAEWVGDMLRGKGFNVGVLTASTDASERQLIVKEFCGERKGKEMRKEDEFRVLVATDAVSRGVDTVAVDHVVLYEFPHTAIDFLHRVGRTARNGAKGRATSFVTKRDVALATAIEAAGRKGEMLA